MGIIWRYLKHLLENILGLNNTYYGPDKNISLLPDGGELGGYVLREGWLDKA